MGGFSLSKDIIEDIFKHAKPLGHHEEFPNLNLGFGFIYYGLVRTLRPRHIAVIGSGFGFSVVCLALGLKDNGFGKLSFVDPSYSLLKDGPHKTIGGSNHWNNPQEVHAHFERFGVSNIVSHFKKTSAQFFNEYEQLNLKSIDVGFIDGNHSFNDVKYDFLQMINHTHKNSYILLHDTHIYIREILRHAGVKRWLNIVKKHEDFFEVVNFPFSSGVALVRVLQDETWEYVQ
jgi:predicted O-methyltransferase YrrM